MHVSASERKKGLKSFQKVSSRELLHCVVMLCIIQMIYKKYTAKDLSQGVAQACPPVPKPIGANLSRYKPDGERSREELLLQADVKHLGVQSFRPQKSSGRNSET